MLRYLAKKAMPPIGDTERTALNCGTVSLDGKIYDGTFTKDDVRTTELTDVEQDYVDRVVPHIIERHHMLGLDEAIELMKCKGIFGLNIATEYGGMGFSPAANSAIMTKFAESGFPALTVTAMVPNSLGPGELLQHYGTEEERNKYLPKLASGEMLPCFALTGPNNGSDATSNMDKGVVNGNTVTATLNKRYITLAPIADLVGLAIDVEGHGITLFLVERDHPGLEIGTRHSPLGLDFANGPIRGTISLDLDKHVLGGRENLGKGWQMLVDCLSVGRAISLPAMGVGLANMIVPAVGAYTQARKQFKVPLWKFEGIQEKLANILYHSTIVRNMQTAINAELNHGEQPAILGAMFKYQATERARILVNEAMDITGGVGIQEGPNNWLAESYRGVPIAITVEGANVLTRCLITFGQGLVRAHPHMQDIIDGAHTSSKRFYKGLGGLIKHMTVNKFRAFGRNKASLFAFTADCTLFLGGKLKKSEYISGRMADFFSNVFSLTLLDGKDDPVSNYVRKRLLWETKVLHREIIKEMPFFLRPTLYLLGFINFAEVEKPRFKDIKDVVKAYHDEALTYGTTAVEGTRLADLYKALNGDTDVIDTVIQVDDS